MSILQNKSKSVRGISSSQACITLKDQLRKSKEAVFKYMALLEKLQVISLLRSQLGNYKETAGGIHSLRADVQSLSGLLCRKTKDCEALHLRSAGYASQLRDLNATVRDLKNSHEELKLFLDMFKRESTDPRDIAETKEQEYRAWAHVESLKSSLDEQNLELRVKAANEAEAVS
ncbi:hypothetical protein Bca4012_035331 [Brassica carinata]